jgi:hypothetical protein
MIDLVRDVLDTQVLDRNKTPMGKVDGLVLELRDGQPPRLACLEIDSVEAWRRVGPRFGRWAHAVARLWRRSEHPFRFSWAQVRDLGIDLEIDVDAEETPAFDLERWLRDKFVARIPWSK